MFGQMYKPLNFANIKHGILQSMECKICFSTEPHQTYIAREMMFGLRDQHTYFQCSACECLQIINIPEDMSIYYPEGYYSFSPAKNFKKWGPRSFMQRARDQAILSGSKSIKDIIKIIAAGGPHLWSLTHLPVSKNDRILDVGCGNGKFLLRLQHLGFRHLLGADPYIAQDIHYPGGITIQKRTLDQIEGTFDVIMMHHAFEHMSNPLETFTLAATHLSPQGWLLIRIPTVSSYAWRHYKTNWVQLDAPRHFFLHSQKSISLLADQAGLEVVKVVYDSSSFQFTGSERYIKNIPLRSDIKDEELFSKDQIAEFRQKAAELNKNNDGDACAFYLQKKKA